MNWRKFPPAGFPPPGWRRQNHPANRVLVRANQLMAEKNYAEAAKLFDQLAALALSRNGLRAPFFKIQTGRCELLIGNFDSGMENLKQGFEILFEQQRYQAFRRFAAAVNRDLAQNGLESVAEAFNQFLKETTNFDYLDSQESPLSPLPSGRHPYLPIKCPSCGAPTRMDEVEWLDSITAVCDFCGSMIRGDEN
jgi:hypothetical protein